MLTSSDIKLALREAGLDVFRSRGDAVFIAERVRENLILDSGVQVEGEPLTVRFVVSAQASEFPGQADATLFATARKLAKPALAQGFSEAETRITPLPDPSDPDRVLDHSFEVAFARTVNDLSEAVEAARFALSLARSAHRE